MAPACGNGIIDEGEVCDGDNLGGQTCESQGLVRGRSPAIQIVSVLIPVHAIRP